MRLYFLGAVAAVAMSNLSCSRSNAPFAPMAEEFCYTTLSFSPATATAQGYHKHKGLDLDRALDDVSRPSINRQRDFYIAFNRRLQAIDGGRLSPEDRADYDIIGGQIALALFDFDVARTWQRNPTFYVELIGNALFNPFVLEYAPQPERMRHIIARLEKVPAFFDQARRNVFQAPEIWIKVAAEENDGNINLVDKVIREAVPNDQKEAYERVAGPALEALRRFNRYLNDDLKPRPRHPDWQLGEEEYKLKFRFALGTDQTPEQVLAAAEADLKKVRAQMLELALPLHAQMFPDHPKHAEENVVISEVLKRISEKRSTPATYLADAKADLEEARAFVRQKNLLSLPAHGNLQVIETPEFMRGIYSVGGFNPAPALEPQLGAFYWVTPIPKDWPPQRVESKLREYNFYKLKLLTMHEAVPGHYVQAEFANDIQPKTRRVLRSIFGNTPYVEGWAQYATQMMLDEGFLNNSPELRLTFLKEELRVIANAIIDIRLQSNKMTEQQALDLTEKETFQEHEEAVGKLQRAQLSSAQLPAYFVGWRGWMSVRDQYKKARGAGYSLNNFNDAALKEGAIPLPVLGRLITR